MSYFLACILPDDCRTRIEEETKPYRVMEIRPVPRWTIREKLHITVIFLGLLSKDNLEKAIETLDQIKWPALELQAGKAGWFKSLLYQSVQASPSFASLSDTIRSDLRSHQIPFDNKPFFPHITIARKADALKDSGIAFQQFPVKITEYGLYHSDGATYTLIRKYPAL